MTTCLSLNPLNRSAYVDQVSYHTLSI